MIIGVFLLIITLPVQFNRSTLIEGYKKIFKKVKL